MRFEPLSHTADKGIRAFGSDLKELFENAAYGMFSLMAELDRYQSSMSMEISVESTDWDELLRSWLDELLYRFEVDRVLFTEFDVAEVSEFRVVGTAKGLAFSSDIEWIGSAVKAVTHHDLSVYRGDNGWEATVIFDV